MVVTTRQKGEESFFLFVCQLTVSLALKEEESAGDVSAGDVSAGDVSAGACNLSNLRENHKVTQLERASEKERINWREQ